MTADSLSPQSYNDALAFLYGRINYERQPMGAYREAHFKLDRMRELVARLGRPDAGQRIIHVAGTKGKGSTATMIAAILTAAGYRTGLYSSPHFHQIEERTAVDGRACSAAELVRLVERVRPAVEQLDAEAPGDETGHGRPTYFEVTTAMALLYFADQRTDATVLEVGLGGRLDSTNVCDTILSVITSISFDHMEQLGSTLAAIAREKAGIIKPGVPVISGVTGTEAARAIRRAAASAHSRLLELERDFSYQYHAPRRVEVSGCRPKIDFFSPPGTLGVAQVSLGMLGKHQGANAALALAAVDELRRQGFRIEERAVREGLAKARCPARIELLHRRPTVIVDVAHNVASAEALAEALDASFAPRRRVLLFAGTRHKDCAGMLRVLLPRFDDVIFTRYRLNPRSVPVEELRDAAAALGAARVRLCEDPLEAWRLARSLADDQTLICVTGSFFIAAELRPVIQSELGAMATTKTGAPADLPDRPLHPAARDRGVGTLLQ
ncbi:MAG: Mur ligase family protein [Pirellulales bacterium]